MISVRPIRVMTMPATSGVMTLRIHGRIWLNATSTSAQTRPMPSIRPSICSGVSPRARPAAAMPAKIAMKLELVPWMLSSPEPTDPKRWIWMKVEMPEMNSDIPAIWRVSAGEAPHNPHTMSDGVTMPAKIASICWRAAPSATRSGGFDSKANSTSDPSDVFSFMRDLR